MKDSVFSEALALATDKELQGFIDLLPESAEQIFAIACAELSKRQPNIAERVVLFTLACFLSRFGGFGCYFPSMSSAQINVVRNEFKLVISGVRDIESTDSIIEGCLKRKVSGTAFSEDVKLFLHWFIEWQKKWRIDSAVFVEVVLGAFLFSSGKSWSFASCDALYIGARNFLIRKSFNGRRGEIKRICMQFGISKSTAYVVLFRRNHEFSK